LTDEEREELQFKKIRALKYLSYVQEKKSKEEIRLEILRKTKELRKKNNTMTL
jgi:hypothetical protein